MESIEQTFNGFPDFGKKVTCPISRNGDLVHRIYLQAELPSAGAAWAGHKLIKSVEVEIGGQRIDKHYADWLHIWNELTQTAGHWDGYKLMVNGGDVLDEHTCNVAVGGDVKDHIVFVPLQFWFCRNPGLALPLIALQYHEVKINIEFGDVSEVLASGTGTLGSASLYVDYIYLDTDERRRFAQVSHEYLIEQLQFTGDETASSKIKLNFNHPCKELVWVEKDDNDSSVGAYVTSYDSAKLQLNGHERFTARVPQYFQLVQPYQHHERVPTMGVAGSMKTGGVNVYSFALKPEEHQPSGTCNMSRIDNATLNLTGVDSSNTVKVFAVNYNVLRVMSGMGGLAYSN
jgi:hypothetical protein